MFISRHQGIVVLLVMFHNRKRQQQYSSFPQQEKPFVTRVLWQSRQLLRLTSIPYEECRVHSAGLEQEEEKVNNREKDCCLQLQQRPRSGLYIILSCSFVLWCPIHFKMFSQRYFFITLHWEPSRCVFFTKYPVQLLAKTTTYDLSSTLVVCLEKV